MEKIGIISNPLKDIGLVQTKKVEQWLLAYGKQPVLLCCTEAVGSNLVASKEQPLDMVIVLGGDGTMIQSARALAGDEIPLIGINLGHLGFLAEIEVRHIEKALSDIFAGRYYQSSRMMIEGLAVEADKQINLGMALNDIVIKHKNVAKMMSYTLYVNGNRVKSYRSDGLIMATPTGSTAYNLSAGGPILVPHARNIIVTPICPHSLMARSLVLDDDDRIEVEVDQRTEGEIILAMDGQEIYIIKPSTSRLVVRRSEATTLLLQLEESDFYTILSKKLKS